MSEDGVNAQIALPKDHLADLYQLCKELPHGETFSQGINLDAVLLEDEFRTFPPFSGLHIRKRPLVTTGLPENEQKQLDYTDCGTEINPLDFHDKIASADSSGGGGPIVLDCRNKYESDVGRFAGSIPLETTQFKESWAAIEKSLQDVPRDKPLYLYCTGAHVLFFCVCVCGVCGVCGVRVCTCRCEALVWHGAAEASRCLLRQA